MLLCLRGGGRLRPQSPDLTIRLVLRDRMLTATTRRTLADAALAAFAATRGRSCHGRRGSSLAEAEAVSDRGRLTASGDP